MISWYMGLSEWAAPIHSSYFEDYWPCAGGLSVNVIATQSNA